MSSLVGISCSKVTQKNSLQPAMQAAGVERMLPERLVRPLSEPPYPLQCLLFAYLSESAIFMQNFCIIYKTLHNSRISGPQGRSLVRQESGGAGCSGDRRCLAFVLNAIIAIASRVNYLQEARSAKEQDDRTPNKRFLRSRGVQQSNIAVLKKVRYVVGLKPS